MFSHDDSAVHDKYSIKSKIKKAPSRRESTVTSTLNVRKIKSKADGNTMINQYVIEKILGKGMFATVKKCKDLKTGEYFAIKQMNKTVLKSKR